MCRSCVQTRAVRPGTATPKPEPAPLHTGNDCKRNHLRAWCDALGDRNPAACSDEEATVGLDDERDALIARLDGREERRELGQLIRTAGDGRRVLWRVRPDRHARVHPDRHAPVGSQPEVGLDHCRCPDSKRL
eukprot:3938835-Rhodomonas_salina.2